MATHEVVTITFDAADDPQLVREWFEEKWQSIFASEGTS